jgi:hypothetical protein
MIVRKDSESPGEFGLSPSRDEAGFLTPDRFVACEVKAIVRPSAVR